VNEKSTRIYSNEDWGFGIDELAISPDRAWVAFASRVLDPRSLKTPIRESIRLMRNDGTEVRTVFETDKRGEATSRIHWSPDGTRLGYLYQPVDPSTGQVDVHLQIYDTQTAKQYTYATHGGRDFDWKADGTQLSLVSYSDKMGRASIVNLADQSQRTLWEEAYLAFDGVAWQPAGNAVAVIAHHTGDGRAEDPEGLYLLDTNTGQQRLLAAGWISEVSWAPDGVTMVYSVVSGKDTHLWLFYLATAKSEPLLSKNAVLGNSPWSPAGTSLLLPIFEEPPMSYTLGLLIREKRVQIPLTKAIANYPVVAW
jgi:Tol biopolymer transport system component